MQEIEKYVRTKLPDIHPKDITEILLSCIPQSIIQKDMSPPKIEGR